MGKRKTENDEQDDFDYIVRKIKKLERKIKYGRRRRRRRHDVAESDSSPRSSRSPPSLKGDDVRLPDVYDSVEEVEPISLQFEPTPATSATADVELERAEPLASTSAAATLTTTAVERSEPIPSTSTAATTLPSTPAIVVPEIDSELLEIFGADPSVIKEYGNEIQGDLAIRLQHTATNGLSPDVRKQLCDKYLPPSNCILIDAPELNPEIRAAISEPVKKRDKGIELKQRQLGRSITCISEAINILISKEEKDSSVIKLLMDANRLLCDHQHQDSVTRRNFILFNLKKEMKDQLIKTKVDRLLFGTNLSETLKIAKSITRSGEELKPTSKPLATKSKVIHQAAPQPQARNNLNWKAPPLNRRPPPGNQRSREPVLKRQHVNNSRASYRAPPPQKTHRR